MTERPSPYLLACHESDASHDTLFPATSTEHILPLGHLVITLDDPAFRQGYDRGARQYHQWHREDRAIEASMLLFLVRNGWGRQQYSDMWQTGYIVGWLGALFAHAAKLGGV